MARMYKRVVRYVPVKPTKKRRYYGKKRKFTGRRFR